MWRLWRHRAFGPARARGLGRFPSSKMTHPNYQAKAGTVSGPACLASAAAIWQPSTGIRRATSKISSPSRLCSDMRSSARWPTAVECLSNRSLGHAARGFPLPFDGAAPADGNDYRHLTCGHLEPGLQTGFCESTGGGWATEFVAHDSQLHDVPDWMSDEIAVTVEPVAGGVHAALRAGVEDGDTVAVIGAGPMGLVTVAALRNFTDPGSIMIGAKYPVQRDLAAEFGADVVSSPDELSRAVRRATGSFMVGPRLSGGADVVIDAVGSAESISQAIGLCRPRGRVVLLGMPGVIDIDLTPVWHRETELVGSYTYGSEQLRDGRSITSFELAIELAGKVPFDKMLSATYPLDRYRDALTHAAEAGSRGAIKIAFDLRNERHRRPT